MYRHGSVRHPPHAAILELKKINEIQNSAMVPCEQVNVHKDVATAIPAFSDVDMALSCSQFGGSSGYVLAFETHLLFPV